MTGPARGPEPTSPVPNPPRALRSEGIALLAVLLLNTSIFTLLVSDARMLREHGTRAEFVHQRGILLGAAPRDEAPPGPVLALLQLTSGTLPLSLFHAALWVDEAVFLLGIWLLGRLHFSSAGTLFFLAVAASGSCLWADQAAVNFRPLQSLPLALALLETARRNGQRVRFWLATNLLILAGASLPPSMALLPAVAACIHLGFLARPRSTPPGPKSAGSAAVAAASLLPLLAWIVLRLGGGASHSLSPSERLMGALSLEHPLRLADLLLGLCPSLDYTLYCGLFTAAFALVGFLSLSPDGKRRTLGAGLAMMLLGAAAFWVSSLVLGDPFGPRPVPVLLPIVRLGLVFLAARGFERSRAASARPVLAWSAVGLGVVFLLCGVLSWSLALTQSSWPMEAWLASPPRIAAFPDLLDPSFASELLGAASFQALLATLLVGLLAGNRRLAVVALPAILAVHGMDVFGWKFRMTWRKTYAVSPDDRRDALNPPDRPEWRGRPIPTRSGLRRVDELPYGVRSFRSDGGRAPALRSTPAHRIRRASAAILALNHALWLLLVPVLARSMFRDSRGLPVP